MSKIKTNNEYITLRNHGKIYIIEITLKKLMQLNNQSVFCVMMKEIAAW